MRAVRGASCLPVTGRTTCYNGTTVIPCAGTGQDGDLQAGVPLSYTDNGDGTITDNNTGLVWEKQSDDGSIHDLTNSYTWGEAFSVHVAGLNSTSFAGYTDWRLPNLRELQSLTNYGAFAPAVSSAFTNCTHGCMVHTCGCTSGSTYWSSTSYVTMPSVAWLVDSFDGREGDRQEQLRRGPVGVRAVRGGS